MRLNYIRESRHIALRSTSILTQQQAAATEAGIAILPSFSADSDPRFRCVLGEQIEFSRTF